ncbi:Alcohol oxidase Short=AOX [Rhizoctonia solani AG-1 IB]|uniref:Alcohol oxidase Short=AOX n=1 Tax=Thanatephorus cucumeris (strain AG1-IB / isolate 7/3/14) TaxID=1108050 RepID=M5CH40_THACB|nr:Alcohol oxidase Short=AOX [Rhizoctonia solani AG-1 IB]
MHQEADIIFVGGGTAACVAAGRLAASNPGLEILVVEQGSDNFKDPSVTTPALYLTHADPESKNTIHWKGTKSDAANGRETGTTSGGILGGGSSINFMMYAQPAASYLIQTILPKLPKSTWVYALLWGFPQQTILWIFRLGMALGDAGSKIRPTPDELKELGPAFNQYWKERFESAPDKPAVIQVIFNGFFGPPFLVPEGLRLILCTNFLGYPMSRGHVCISSADPYAPPNFRSGLIEEQADVEFDSSVDHFLREVVRRMPSYRGEPASLHPKFPEGSVAGCVRLDEPPSKEQDNLVYTPEDDKVLEDFIRQSAEATPHSVGTVRMAPKAKGGCVDDRLNTTNVLTKSTDLSILPGSIGANSYSTALMMGEKAAILIAEDLRLNLP